MGQKFYLETFGCQMNVVDSEQIAALLADLGFCAASSAEEADLIILNTCSIREKAERKVVGHLWRFKPLKEANPELVIAVGGCVAQQEGERLLQRLPHVDLVFGTHNIHRLPELLRRVRRQRERIAEVAFLDRETRLALFPERRSTGEVVRYVTVMQGCDNFCTYCVVPHVRGREISRPSGAVLAEVGRLVGSGVREVTLIGQNVNSYGGNTPGELSFAELLAAVHDIPALERVRFVTSHPKDISQRLIDCYATLPRLCRHIHLPLQSGSDRVLREMRRGYTAADYLDKVARLRSACPEIRFTSDIIVGFPGETEADFLDTLAVVQEVGYADIYTFLYSPRPGTQAPLRSDGLSPEVQQERFDRLLELQERIGPAIWRQDVGRTLPLLVEGESRQGGGQLFGRTTWGRIVNFAGGRELIGQVIPVTITASYRNSQLGEYWESNASVRCYGQG
ncbi:MAG: tRNA (N6-isopentenyl adenosine(37)-C2)-methylthiotransferase MiaB [Deltaproteobacteria bacterium]|nr:tRNA (N6-isopentenyl adenosine(37)-C2)-methylthiotransferase MiaB [Deltaproteobacteria bacterium]